MNQTLNLEGFRFKMLFSDIKFILHLNSSLLFNILNKQSPLPLDHENLILLNFVNFSAPWQYPNLFVLNMLNLFLGTE